MTEGERSGLRPRASSEASEERVTPTRLKRSVSFADSVDSVPSTDDGGTPGAARSLLSAFNSSDKDDGRAPGTARTLSTAFDGFAALPHAVGDVTYGPPAEIAERAWTLCVFPGGIANGFKEYISVHLALDARSPNAKTDVTLRLINHAGGEHLVHALKRGTIFGSNPCRHPSGWLAAPANPSWGVVGFALRADILDASQGWLNERGALVIEADISVYSSEPPPPLSEPQPAAPRPDPPRHPPEGGEDPDVAWAMETLGVDAGEKSDGTAARAALGPPT